jgi:predicted  nucleic acid-binding Zn-ribbon protein
MAQSNAELESTIKELKVTNEHLKSTNEDLKSTNEDLVTKLCMIEQDRDSDADLAREKLTECQRNCANLQKEYDYLDNRDNFELRNEIDEKTLTIDKLQSQIVDCQSQIGIIHANTEAAEAEHASKRLSAEAAFAELTSDYNALQVDYNLHRDKVIKEPEGGGLLWNAYRTSQKGFNKTIPQLQAGYAAQRPGGKRPDKKTNSTNIM